MKARLPHCLLQIALLVGVSAAAAQGVQRCESTDGKVTYSNTQCPEGTSAVRKVNTAPPVAVDDQKAAKERAKRDSAEVKSIDKTKAQEQARAEREAADRKKVEAKQQERCERAQKDLERTRSTRAALDQRAATVEQMQKADKEIGRREVDAAKACPS
jgi:hypothetical protein